MSAKSGAKKKHQVNFAGVCFFLFVFFWNLCELISDMIRMIPLGWLASRLTIAYDKSILIGKKKWNDVVVLRSTLHLNKSTCHYKLQPQRVMSQVSTTLY